MYILDFLFIRLFVQNFTKFTKNMALYKRTSDELCLYMYFDFAKIV